MKIGLTFVALLLLLVAPAAATSQSEADKVKAVLATQARLLKQGRFRVMYDSTYTANFRAHCPWGTYLRRQRFGRRYLGPGFTVRRVRARILSGTQALLAYRFVRANGQVAAEVTFRQRDLYVKIGQQWYDEYDRVSDC
jgi:hypothetical protein